MKPKNELMDLQSKYSIWIAGLCVIFLIFSLLGGLVVGEFFLLVSGALMLWALVTLQLEIYHRNQKQFDKIQRNYRYTEALFSIFSTLKINHPLPEMGNWAITPDTAKIILDIILREKPKLILEAGSGLSTIIAAYALQKLGEGKVISLEEKEQYAATTTQNLKVHQLTDRATVVYAALTEHQIGGKTWLWYDISNLKELGEIDLLIVDGPIQHGRPEKMIRYPALPILIKNLSKNAIIIMDDYHREDEKQILEAWSQEFEGWQIQKINSEYGTVIMRRQ